MAKCLNCDDNAVFLIKNQGTLEQEFCDPHLPKMYNKLRLPNIVERLDAAPTTYEKLREKKEAEVVAVREKTKAKKKAEAEAAEAVVTPVEEVPVEETPVEETPAE